MPITSAHLANNVCFHLHTYKLMSICIYTYVDYNAYRWANAEEDFVLASLELDSFWLGNWNLALAIVQPKNPLIAFT